MRKRLQIALAALFVAIGGVVAWQVLRAPRPEPVYQGKPLAVWLRDSVGTEELTNAVRQLGVAGELPSDNAAMPNR